MKRNTKITVIRAAILATAMTCGAIGVKWHRSDSKAATLELLDLADTISHQLAEADELEQRLVAEGRAEETYQVYDIRRNVERDWIDIKATLRDSLGILKRRRLFACDILTEPEAVRAATADLRLHLDNRAAEFVMLGTSMILLLATLVIKPARPAGETAAMPETDAT